MTPPLVLRLSADRAMVRLIQRGQTVWAAECPYRDGADLRHAIARLVDEKPLRARQRFVRVELERCVIQVRALRDIPPVGTRALQELVASHANKFFRRPRGGSLCVAAAWVTRQRHEAKAVAVSRALVDSIVAGAVEASLTVVAIEPVDSEVPTRLTLLPASARRGLRRTSLRQLGLVAALGALLWVAAGAVYLADLVHDHRSLAAELDTLRGPLDGLAGARRDLSNMASMVRRLEAVELERGWVSSVLARLTAALPDSAFLRFLSLDRTGRGRVIVAGVDRAATMILFEQSGLAGSARVDAEAETPDGTISVVIQFPGVQGPGDEGPWRHRRPDAAPSGSER